jgi:hypothetical protein
MGRVSESHSLVPCGLPQYYSEIEQRVSALFGHFVGSSMPRAWIGLTFRGVDAVEVVGRHGDGKTGWLFPRPSRW